MKSVKTSSGTLTLYPHQVFCYRSVVDALEAFLKKTNFVQRCKLWRREVPIGTLSDIYDGRIWTEFLRATFFIIAL